MNMQNAHVSLSSFSKSGNQRSSILGMTSQRGWCEKTPYNEFVAILRPSLIIDWLIAKGGVCDYSTTF